jgi:hypothetical protein
VIKICLDCKYHVVIKSSVSADAHCCKQPELVNRVTGEPELCETRRVSGAECGANARKWEAK